MIGAIVAITLLMLIAILRAPLLAAVTIALNLFSVGAAIGVVTLICKLPAGFPLGGHPYIDTVGAQRSSASPSASRSTTRCSCWRGCASATRPRATMPPPSATD